MSLNELYKGLNQPLNLSHNTSHQIIAFILLLLIWFMIYALIEISFNSKIMKKKDLLDTKNRIVSIIHGVVSFSCGSY